MKTPGRVAMGAAGSILALPVIAEAVSVQLRKRARAELIERPNGSAKRVLVAFPAFANSAVSVEEMLPFFGSANAFLVNYSSSGHDSKALFEDLVDRLKAYAGARLELLGVSFGAGVALAFRRFLNLRAPGKFPYVRFILYSPVTSRHDIAFEHVARAALGFVLHGGLISNALWRFTGGSKQLHGTPPPFDLEVTEERLAQIHESIDNLTLNLISSEARAILVEHRPPQIGEFRSDRVLIFHFQNDYMMKRGVPEKLVRSFGPSQIVTLSGNGHADIYRLPTLGKIMRPAIEDFLQAQD